MIFERALSFLNTLMMVLSLPVFLTPLIGREQELATLEQLLRHTDVRLVTITGPGGVGKTRLAVAAASILADDFPGAITFISLVPITDPDFVWPAVTAALGIQNGEDASHTALERLTRFIHEKPTLLILDNFEPVIEAASAIPELLAACPNLKIMATSRQNLRVRGEQEFAVPLLGLPDFERLTHDVDLATILPRYPAVRLFLERMQAIQMDYEPDQATLRAIAAICVRLDGLPLAIELAAPLTRVFSPEQLHGQQALVRERKAKIAHFAKMKPPLQLGTVPWLEPPASEPLLRAGQKFLGVAVGGAVDGNKNRAVAGEVRGNAGSPGIARGVAKVVRSLAEAGKIEPGDILIAETTSPPWTPLFATVAAVVTDTGGVLSHCAIVAREYRIPAVVGTVNATNTFSDGQMVQVDGDHGIVRML